MSSLTRLLAVVELFSGNESTLSVEEIAARQKLSVPTAYRYVRELCKAGLLARVDGRYALGPRIITLDYIMRQSDPMERIGRPIMQELSKVTGCSVLISQLYHDQVVNLYFQPGHDTEGLRYGRGQVSPLFRGATSLVILAFLKPNHLKQLYLRHAKDADLGRLAGSWGELQDLLKSIRKAGFAVSSGELERHRAGLAAPIVNAATGVVGGLTVVGTTSQFNLFSREALSKLVMERAQQLSKHLSRVK
jgi:DNA-binding IclR family transcriptional regulator